MSRPKTVKEAMQYIKPRRDKKAEAGRVAKAMNTDITKMTTREILARVYDRHSTGVWMSASVLLGVSTVLAVIY